MTKRPWDPYQAHSQRMPAMASGTKVLDAPAPAPRPIAPPPLQVIDGVPVGTTVQIQDWVGDDPERARSAWKREREQDRPRITLLTHLEAVLKRHNLGPAPVPLGPSPAPGDPLPQPPAPIPVEHDSEPRHEKEPEETEEPETLL